MKALADDRRCFACGPDNPIGLRLTFEYGDDSARTVVTPARQFGGWTDIIHGGIVATLLDEAMAHAAIACGVRAVTARLEVRFRKAVPVGRPLVLEGRITGRRGRVLEMRSELTDAGGTLYANALGKFVADT